MKSTILCALLFIFMTSCSEGNVKGSYWEASSLKGKVESVKTITFEAERRFGEIAKGDIDEIEFCKFDNKGKLLEVSQFDSDGETIYESFYTYDGDILRECKQYTFGKLERTTIFAPRKDNVDEVNIYNAEGDKIIQERHEYSDDNLLIAIKTYNLEDNSIDSVSFTYENGRLKSQICHDSDGSEAFSLYYEYKQGKMSTSISKYIFDNTMWGTKYTYDPLSKAIIQEENGSYGEDGAFKAHYTAIYQYEYDNKGNWIKKVSNKKDSREPLEIVEREIVYF